MSADRSEHAPLPATAQRGAAKRGAAKRGAAWLPALHLRAALGVLVIAGASGCTQTLDLASLRDPTAPTAIIPYAGVRTGDRRHADYSGIDRRILEDKR